MDTRHETSIPRVVVVATGGTIASRFNESGSASVSDNASRLLETMDFPVAIEAVDVIRVNSYLLTPAHIRHIVEAVRAQADRPEVLGVVVTHGTDTLEETSFAAALCLSTSKPIVFTGAQRTPDSPDSDGARNLRDALYVAASKMSRDRGVLVVFAGEILSAVSCRKVHTLDLSAFAPINVRPLGRVEGDQVYFADPPRPALGRLTHLEIRRSFDDTRVDVGMLYPGFNPAILDAFRAQGSEAIILGAMGAGNGGPGVLSWVADAVSAGFFVGLSTRVPNGPVLPIYGVGGGADLLAAGAVSTRSLPIFQARVLVALLASTPTESLSARVHDAINALAAQ